MTEEQATKKVTRRVKKTVVDKELQQKKDETQLAVLGAADWGIKQNVAPRDISFATVGVLQKPNKEDMDLGLNGGDIVDFQAKARIADKDTYVEFIPVSFKRKRTLQDINNKKAFVALEAVTPNHLFSREDFHHVDKFTSEVKRVIEVETLVFAVHLIEDLKRGEQMPKIVSFKSTGIKTGRALVNQMFSLTSQGLAPCHRILKMKSCFNQAPKSGNTWWTINVYPTNVVTPVEYQQTAYKALETFNIKEKLVEQILSEEVKPAIVEQVKSPTQAPTPTPRPVTDAKGHPVYMTPKGMVNHAEKPYVPQIGNAQTAGDAYKQAGAPNPQIPRSEIPTPTDERY